MVALNVNFIYEVNHGCEILVLLMYILGRENNKRNWQQSVPWTWRVNYHSFADIGIFRHIIDHYL